MKPACHSIFGERYGSRGMACGMRSGLIIAVVAVLGIFGSLRPALAIDAGMPNPPASPTVVKCAIIILDVVDIDDVNESFVAEIALLAEWDDPRLAFDAAEEGVDRKIFQGNFQFSEVFTGWWPQLILVNEVGPPDPNAVKIEVYPDGHVRYLDQHNAVLETPMDLRDYPFDSQKLQAELVPFGDNTNDVVLDVHETYANATDDFVRHNSSVNVAGWMLQSVTFETDETFLNEATKDSRISRLIATIHLQRRSWQLVWQMLFPLLVIVSMIWSIFWVDIDSLADRLNVAFVGVLTIVAYQFVVIDNMPRMSYLTLTDVILLISFVTMSLTIPQSLVIYGLVRKGEEQRAQRIDHISRCAFPLGYMAMLAMLVAWYAFY
ncbi:MAG: hypothetical protein O2946_11595 [Planctomycetota bacterium]|nr:hypothetical protein [Planctomycetota bacterium]